MNHLGEVLSTNAREFTAQAVKINESPAFGGFVKVAAKKISIFGIVYNITTGSIDGNRKPIAFGKNEDELFSEQPQLVNLLKTEFSSIIVGHKSDQFWGCMPQQPPRIHSFVEACSNQEIMEITKDLRYLQVLLSANTGYDDQLLISSIRIGADASNDKKEFLIKTGKFLLPLLKHDMDRFNNIFRSVR